MWRASQTLSPSSAASQEPSSISTSEHKLPGQVCDDLRSHSHEEVKIGRGQFVKGKISGSGPLFIDGRVEGDIDIPNERVTIGEHGVFVAHARKEGQFGITAREIVIMGQVIGMCVCLASCGDSSERVHHRRSETPRLRIADGGFLRGGVNLREDKRELPAGTA